LRTNDKQKKCYHLLIVDDHRLICEALCSLLHHDYYYYPDIAFSGKQALNKLKSRSFDAILLDIQMPNMNGYEVACRVRELDQNLPIIGISAYQTEVDGEMWRQAGINIMASKSINIAKLNQLIRTAISLQRPQQDAIT